MAPPDNSGSGDSGFLGRWSRRKQEVQNEKSALAPAVDASPVEAAALVEVPAESPPAERDDSLPLPSLDDISPGGDVSVFFQKHVPEALRAAALRKVWMTDPDIKDFIEMADYQLDYANPDSIPGWSSSIEGIDLKSMVERIFNNPAKIDAEIPDIQGGLPLAESDALSGETEKLHTHSTLVESSEQSVPSHTPLDVNQNGAVQNKQDESVVYETARKRHGGALPS